jgi:hypothetical protein
MDTITTITTITTVTITITTDTGIRMATRPVQLAVEYEGRRYAGIYSVSGNLMIARIPGIDSRSHSVDDVDEAQLARTLFFEILAAAKRSGRLN